MSNWMAWGLAENWVVSVFGVSGVVQDVLTTRVLVFSS